MHPREGAGMFRDIGLYGDKGKKKKKGKKYEKNDMILYMYLLIIILFFFSLFSYSRSMHSFTLCVACVT